MLDGMTNIKASEVLKEIKYYTEDLPHYSPDEVAEALETAIKDLEQQPTDAVSRSELQKTMDSLPLFRFVNNDHEEADDYYNCESVDMVIRNLPSVTPRRDLAETSQDCVSRKAVRKILVEAKEYGSWDDSSQINRQDALDYVDMLPSVTPQASGEDIHREREQAYMLGYEDASKKFRTEPCEDCISREEVQDLISRWLSDYLLDETREALETINYKIGDMPSVIPQRKVGKWTREPIRNEKGGCIGAKMICSECDNDNKHDEYMKFCPNCGAEMGGSDEVSD